MASPVSASPFAVSAEPEERGWRIGVGDGSGVSLDRVLTPDQTSFAAWHDELAQRFGLWRPGTPADGLAPGSDPRLRTLLTSNAHEHVLYGYGDPAVLRVEEDEGPAYYLVVTSNDAPNAFPILRSADLESWDYLGCVFPADAAPSWAETRAGFADFWAPELHRVGDRFWLCFTARKKDGALAIGLATAPTPTGPWRSAEKPLLEGDVIDAHLLVEPGQDPLLFWKEDRNGLWPMLLVAHLEQDPRSIPALFVDPEQQRTASLYLALAPWLRMLAPMDQFFGTHRLIEMVTTDFAAFRQRLRNHASGEQGDRRTSLEAIERALTTRILAQSLVPDGSRLAGDPVHVLENDLDWEAHLIEGPWVHRHDRAYYLFYAGNDFSTHRYGIGCAIAPDPLGPYRKLPHPVLRSTAEWLGPGHPSVAEGPDGIARLFFHAYQPGHTGYRAFRALLSARLKLTPTAVEVF